MRVLVTGGRGFIGKHLVQALSREEGVTVASLDLTVPTNNYRHEYGVDGVLHIAQDILDYNALSLVFDNFRPHIVYHLAAKLGVLDVMDKPGETVAENVLGTLHVANLCKAYKAHLIFASTSDVYGQSTTLPFREDGMCAIGPSVEPRWSYAISKLAGEHLTLAMQGTVIRFFNVTGPGQQTKYVVPIMVQQALKGEPITVYGGGSSTRCFAAVGDVVRALLGFIDLPTTDISGEIYNIGNDRSISMCELAERVREYVNIDCKIVDLEYPENYTEMPHRIPNLDKIHGLLDWKCEITLEELIRDIAQSMA